MGLYTSCPSSAAAQPIWNSTVDNDQATPASRWASLPTDRYLREQSGRDGEPLAPAEPSSTGFEPPLDLKTLLTPRFAMSAEWEPVVEGIGIQAYDVSMQVPTYPIFGPPPPLITSGYSFTQLDAPDTLDLPSSLHEFSLGLAWMRPINERWLARFTLSSAFASDLANTGSDAWQLRGGGFGIYRPNEQWSFALGAMATGRDDIPVFPAVGAIWEPSPWLKVNLMMPNPRVSWLWGELGRHQSWAYFGGGIGGGTWAYDRDTRRADRLNYREWRLVVGWELTPPQPPGTFRPTGPTFNAEVGYILGRRFEFDSAAPDISIDDALLLRTAISF
jgi:hypothetical protein